MTTIIRRYRLGKTSCNAIVGFSEHIDRVARNDQGIPEDDMYIRWGCTANLPSRNVVNTAEAIHLVNNKREFRRILQRNELCPRTWFEFDDVPNVTTGPVFTHAPPFPVVLRPQRHAQGRRLWVCQTLNELEQRLIAQDLPPGGYYVSEIIDKVAEYRVFVVQGRAVAVARKTPGNPEDVAWNVARGGRFDNVRWDNWPLKAVKKSIEAFNLSGLDFGGVDVMVDGDGGCYVIEINSAPSLTSPYRQECMARALDYIIINGKATIPLVEERGGYTKFIHPAVCERARLI